MAYKIIGSVLAIGPAQTLPAKSGNTYTKRDLIIAVRMFDPNTGQPTDNMENTPKFTFLGDRCRDLDAIKVGDLVTVSFELYGRAYTKDGKQDYITDVRPVRIEINKQMVQQQPQQVAPAQPQHAVQGFGQPQGYPPTSQPPFGQTPSQGYYPAPQSDNSNQPF